MYLEEAKLKDDIIAHRTPNELGFNISYSRGTRELISMQAIQPESPTLDQLICRFKQILSPTAEEIAEGADSFPFSASEMTGPHFVLLSDGIFISYALIYAIRFGTIESLTGLHDEDLTAIGVPEYELLRCRVSAIENFGHPQFRMRLELYDKYRNEIVPTRMTGPIFKLRGSLLFITPVVDAVVKRIAQHDLVRANASYQTDVALQKKEYAEVRLVSTRAGAQVDTFIADNNMIFLESLPYEVGRDVLNRPVLAPVLPWSEREMDFDFQNVLSRREDDSIPPHINLSAKKGGRRTRVVFSPKAWDEFKTIRRLNREGGAALEDAVENPNHYFSTPPRVSIEGTFSDRVSGFILGKYLLNRSDAASGRMWSSGFEENSLIIRTSNGAILHLGATPTPVEYAILRKACSQFERELEEHEGTATIASGFAYTPLPASLERTVSVPELQAEFSLTEIHNVCRAIEATNQPKLEAEELPAANEVITNAEANGLFLVSWKDANGDPVEIPLASLKRAIPKELVTDRGVQVAPQISESTSLLGRAPDWDWRSRKPSAEEGLQSFKVGVGLHSHQETGYSWLRWLAEHTAAPEAPTRHQKGAFLADDMGLGKTIQVLAFATHALKVDPLRRPVLIVAPVSLISDSWKKDGIEAFLDPGFSSVVDFKECPIKVDTVFLAQEASRVNEEMSTGGKSFYQCAISQDLSSQLQSIQTWAQGKIVFCSYETLRSKSVVLASMKFASVILDEAQKIKNVGVLQTNAAKALNADFYIAMTGTPIENSLVDLWSIMDFVLPGHLGSLTDFRKRFVDRITSAEPGSSTRAILRAELENALKPVWLRRTKAEVFRGTKVMPPITHFDSIPDSTGTISNIHQVMMSPSQRGLYDQYMGIFNSLTKGHRLAAIRSLMEVCSSPWLATDVDISWSNRKILFDLSPKLEKTFEILEQIYSNSAEAGRKVIIFANTIPLQTSLAYLIADWHRSTKGSKIEVEVFNGEKSPAARSQILLRFKESEGFQVIVISPRSGGAGLNITHANHIIHYTREWNPALESQATARAYRIGQKLPVFVYYPTTTTGDPDAPSAEEHLAQILRSKRDIMEDFTVSMDELSAKESSFDSFSDRKNPDTKVVVTPSMVSTLSPSMFERLVGMIFKTMGHEVRIVGGTGDGGVDVVALSTTGDSVLIQTKHTQLNHIQYTEGIREVRGAHTVYEKRYNRKFKLLVATNGKFAEQAIHLANEGTAVQLMDGVKISNFLKANEITLQDLESLKNIS